MANDQNIEYFEGLRFNYLGSQSFDFLSSRWVPLSEEQNSFSHAYDYAQEII